MSARQQTQNGKLYITYTCNNACRGFTRCKGFSHKKMEDAFLKYLDTLNSMEPDESVMKKNDKENDLQRKIDILNSKMEKLDAKAKSVRNQFINDLLSVEEYHELNREIEKQKKVYCDEISEFNNKNTKSKPTISYDDIKVGDVISFRVSDDIRVTHRVEKITAEGMITKGDANNTNDPDPVTKDNYIGKTVFAIPHLGAVLGFFRTMGGMIVLGITGVLIIALKQYCFRVALSTIKNTEVVCQTAGGAKHPESVLAGIFPQMTGIIWSATAGII